MCEWAVGNVAPYTGAWIETVPGSLSKAGIPSHPIRVRGLKPWKTETRAYDSVAPYTGAWIETRRYQSLAKAVLASHPIRVRGLKLS